MLKNDNDKKNQKIINREMMAQCLFMFGKWGLHGFSVFSLHMPNTIYSLLILNTILYVSLVTYSSDVQSISIEGKECPTFSSSQIAAHLLRSRTEELTLRKLYAPLTHHLAPAFVILDGCRKDGVQ